MEAREVADKVNDFGRDPIGEGREEQVILFLSLSPFLPVYKLPFYTDLQPEIEDAP